MLCALQLYKLYQLMVNLSHGEKVAHMSGKVEQSLSMMPISLLLYRVQLCLVLQYCIGMEKF